jgi:uncharacterized protein
VDEERIDRVVAAVGDERPDLILLLGDYVGEDVLFGSAVAPEAVAERLGALRAPRGVVAVLGNHDWYTGGRRIADAIAGAGLPVLEDDAVPAGPGLWVAGVSDERIRGADVAGALAAVPPDEAVLLLSHDPDVFPFVPARVALTLSGHTHGGQVDIPLVRRHFIPSRYGDRYARGHVVEGGRHLYVSSGLGTSGLPVRLLRPPEVVTLTLRSPTRAAPRRARP